MNANLKSADGGFRVFLLDDDPLDTELIRAALKQGLDCHVVGLRTRPEFLAALGEQMPDVIVSDSNVPSFDGLTTLALAQRICPQIPFIFCSGNESPILKANALAHGAKDWVSKNNMALLIQTVRRLVAGE